MLGPRPDYELYGDNDDKSHAYDSWYRDFDGLRPALVLAAVLAAAIECALVLYTR